MNKIMPADNFVGQTIKAWVDGEYRELTDVEMVQIHRGKKTLKTNGESQYVFIDPPEKSLPGSVLRRKNTHLTPPKKKRKKHGRR